MIIVNRTPISFVWTCLMLLILASCSKNNKAPESPGLPVTIAESVQKDVPLYVEAIGNVYSLQTVEIRPQVGGIILESYVKQGQFVKKGDPLYLIDPRPYQANLDLAKGALVKDTATLKFDALRVERYAELAKQDYFSKINYEQFQATVEMDEGQVISDKANVILAEINLDWCIPKAPIDGKISQYNIDPGNLVIANDTTALTTIRKIDPADIRFSINQKDFFSLQQSIREGQLKFDAILPQDTKNPREGQIYFIDNTLDLNTGTILVKGTIPNADEYFWPGEFVKIRLQLKILPNAILVPEEALGYSQNGLFLYVYNPESSTVEFRAVTKGEKVDKMVVIENGVGPGEKVVTKGQLNLRPGSKVFLAETNLQKTESR